MQGPRPPETHELKQVVDFLDANLRQDLKWTITSEYPTALTQNNIHNMSIITEDEKIVSHAVLKTLIIKTPFAIFKVGAIGSVVTDPNYRQRGHSRKNIERCIQMAEEQQCDIVVLWTDQFDFYRKLGFELAGFDYSYVIESAKPIKNKNLRFESGNNVDPAALNRLYSQHTVHALRSNDDFKQYLKIPNSNLFTAWNQQNQIVAYAVEGKGLDLINYVHEWAGQTEALMDLFNYIYQQKQSPLTIMTPSHSENLHRNLEACTALAHQGFLGMLKLINKKQLFAKIKRAFRAEGLEQIVLEEQNGMIIFGYGTDLYTLDKETDLTQILFGPMSIANLDFMAAATKEKLTTLLPLPIWVWGWDSI